MVALASGYIIVTTSALGMHSIYCTQPSGRFTPSCFSAMNAIYPLHPCYNYYIHKRWTAVLPGQYCCGYIQAPALHACNWRMKNLLKEGTHQENHQLITNNLHSIRFTQKKGLTELSCQVYTACWACCYHKAKQSLTWQLKKCNTYQKKLSKENSSKMLHKEQMLYAA